MKTYTATFFADANYARQEIEAETPEHALAAARKLDEDNDGSLWWEDYDDGMPTNQITVCDEDGNDVAEWRDDDLLLRLAADELLAALESQTEAAQAVIDNWEKGDLAAAVRSLGASIPEARAAISTAEKVESRNSNGSYHKPDRGLENYHTKCYSTEC